MRGEGALSLELEVSEVLALLDCLRRPAKPPRMDRREDLAGVVSLVVAAAEVGLAEGKVGSEGVASAVVVVRTT